MVRERPWVGPGHPEELIAEQMGWSERSVEKMIATYGHTSVGAGAEPVRPIRSRHQTHHVPVG
jgi:hypothetical protein